MMSSSQDSNRSRNNLSLNKSREKKDSQTNKERQSIESRNSKSEEKSNKSGEEKRRKSCEMKPPSKSKIVGSKTRVGFSRDTVFHTEAQKVVQEQINLLCKQVQDSFSSVVRTVKNTFDDKEAIKAFQSQATELSELWTETASALKSKAPSVSNEEVRNVLIASSNSLQNQSERLRSKLTGAEDCSEEILLCVETSMMEFRRLDKTMRSDSGEVTTLLRKVLEVALEEMSEIASSPFDRRKK